MDFKGAQSSPWSASDNAFNYDNQKLWFISGKLACGNEIKILYAQARIEKRVIFHV